MPSKVVLSLAPPDSHNITHWKLEHEWISTACNIAKLPCMCGIDRTVDTLKQLLCTRFAWNVAKCLTNVLEKWIIRLWSTSSTAGYHAIAMHVCAIPNDHNILLNKLEHYGIRGLALSWIQSYLTNRTQYVSINDTNSTCINVTCRVPQGSILGPILFILYIHDMHTVSSLMKCIIFADDTNFLYTGNDISEMCKTVSKELDKLSSWFMANKLSLNISKTNCMVISRKQIVNNPIVSINSINIERVYITKFLGVHIDCQLDWNGHIKSIQNKIAKNVSVMNRVKHLLNSHVLYSLYTTLIIPYMNYCCEFWGNNYKSRIQPLYMLQKKAIRICKHEGYLSHTRPIFFTFLTLCVFTIWSNIVAWCSCLRFTIINFLAICCVSLIEYMIVIIITPAKMLTISR